MLDAGSKQFSRGLSGQTLTTLDLLSLQPLSLLLLLPALPFDSLNSDPLMLNFLLLDLALPSQLLSAFALLLLPGIAFAGAPDFAVPVLAGSAAYAVAESLRWPIGLGLSLAEARGFYVMLSAATLLGVAIDFSGVDSIRMLLWAAMVNGVISVPIMAVMMLLAVRPAVMGAFVISRRLRTLGWVATAVMALAVSAMFALA